MYLRGESGAMGRGKAPGMVPQHKPVENQRLKEPSLAYFVINGPVTHPKLFVPVWDL